jgi:polygalacturonase
MNAFQPPFYNIREFGAKGDGRAKDTAAIQSAVDACHKGGGGVVLCPPGTYLTGSLQLRSNVNLHLTGGALLLGSTEQAD